MMAVEKGNDGAHRTRKKSKSRRRKQGETDEQFQRRTAKMEADRARRQRERDLLREKAAHLKGCPEEVLYANYAPRHVDTTSTLAHVVSWSERQRERLAEMVAQQERAMESLRQLADQESTAATNVGQCERPSVDVKKIDGLSTCDVGTFETPVVASNLLKSKETVGTFFASTEVGGVYIPKGYINPTPQLRETETCNLSEKHHKTPPTLVRAEIHPIFAIQSDHAEDPITIAPAAVEVGVAPVVPVHQVPRLLLGSSVELTVERAAEMALITGWLTQVRVVSGNGAQVLRFGVVEQAELGHVLRSCFALTSEFYTAGKILSGPCQGLAVYAVALRKALHGCALAMATTTALDLLRHVGRALGPVPVGMSPSPERLLALYGSVVEAELRSGTFVILGT